MPFISYQTNFCNTHFISIFLMDQRAISGEANIEEGTKLLEKIKGNNFHTHILFKKDSHDFQGRAKKLSPLFCCSIHFFYFSQLNNMGNGSMVSIA